MGKKIKEYLLQHGIKQTFLVKQTGLSKRVINDICTHDRKVECTEYYKICKALDLPFEFFFEN